MALVFPSTFDAGHGYDGYNPHSMSRRPSMYGGYDQDHYYDPIYGGGVKGILNHQNFD
jgi:hypothetical protein